MPTPKVAHITGSARRRIGWHVADPLGQRGYRLVIYYNKSAAEAQQTTEDFRTRGMEAIAVGADLADEQQVRKLIGETLSHFGRIDVLVNCAATWKRKPLEDVTAADVRGYLDANTLGTFLCCQ